MAYLVNNEYPNKEKVVIVDNSNKRVLQIDKLTKEIIKIHNSVSEASISVGGHQSILAVVLTVDKKLLTVIFGNLRRVNAIYILL